MPFPISRRWRRLVCLAATALAGCAAPPPAAPPQPVPPPAPTRPGVAPQPTAPGLPAQPRVSQAATPRAYRVDGATHLYELNAARIFKGRLPPMLYAIGVVQVSLDRQGRVGSIDWLRPPRDPEVRAEIERTIRAASPFPAPQRLGRVVYTDTWLWDRSGRFQLDTLTEGQDGG